MKFLTKVKYLILSVLLLLPFVTIAQEIIEDKKEVIETVKEIDSTQRIKIDGVAAVVGDFVVLDSDIDKKFLELEQRGVSINDIPRCELFGSLLEEKLYMHHAIQDSLEVNDAEIRSRVDQQINAFAQQIGSMKKLLEYYKKDDEQELRDEMFELNKNGEMANLMRESIIEEIEVTPEEVRQFFNSIPKDERPVFGTELKVAQIVVIPKTTEEEKQKVINRLKEFKADVTDNGASFTTKAVLYTDDVPSRKNGGKYTLNRKRPQMVKEFRAVAFALQEGEISDPFETDFGYHIILLEKIRGQEYDVRHILLRPKVTQQAVNEAREKLELARKRIVDGEISFADAALEVSDEKETKYEGGLLINPETQDYIFPLTKMDPELYSQIQNLKDKEVSLVLKDADRINPEKFKILTVTDRTDEHEANFAKDYVKIKELALRKKQLNAIEKWQEEKIMDTFIKLNGEHRECNFNSNWLKNKN
ncbi:MAG: peptidylprolyl isomerase [Bacteroidetes bacterium]|nr:MAG: peptidylprolyl isomerase [Bacteroidota bacterium]